MSKDKKNMGKGCNNMKSCMTEKMKKMKENISDSLTSRSSWATWEEWLEFREEKQDGLPNSSHGAKSAGGRDKGEKSSGVNSHVDDLSGDYKGHMKDNGTVDPYKKMKSKGGKAVADVGK